MTTPSDFISRVKNKPESILFSELMTVIDAYYNYVPSAFKNGIGNDCVDNTAGQNEGSCKLFAFAQHQNLTQQETLDCFGEYYREDVLKTPNGNDHSNIRTFMKYGWQGIVFDGNALSLK